MKKYLLTSLALLSVLCGCSGGNAEEIVAERATQMKAKLRHERRTDPISVRAVRVDYSDNVASSVLVGTVEPSKSALVTTQYPGCIRHIFVHKGQTVSAGDVLAEVDAQSVNSAYDASKAVYEQAMDALKRIEQVYSSGSVPEVKMVEAKTAVAKAEATFRSAEKAKLDSRIRAPYSGVVGDIFPHEGMELAAMAPVLKLLDVSAVEIHAYVPENEYSAYSTGMPVQIEVPATVSVLDGVLAVKGIDASRATRSYDCTFKFATGAQTSGIMPGMLCKVRMTGAYGNVIVIPTSAVMADNKGRYVWCCNEGKITKTHITVGGFSGKGIIVTSGLDAGNMVVIDGSRKISSGMSGIRVIEELAL